MPLEFYTALTPALFYFALNEAGKPGDKANSDTVCTILNIICLVLVGFASVCSTESFGKA